MISVTLYKTTDFEGYEHVRDILNSLQEEFPHVLTEIDVQSDPALSEKYKNSGPELIIGPYTIYGEDFKESTLRMTLGAAIDRRKQIIDSGSREGVKRIERGQKFTGADKFGVWISKTYMYFIAFFLLIYIGLPFLAPVLMHQDKPVIANVIYKMFSPLCHQLAFRSLFLYGEQPYYPRELANLDGYLTYEEVTGEDPEDIVFARNFVGNEALGYKVALCQRDIALYGAMLLFSVIFIISGRRIKAVPWYIWLIFGVLPIGIDGVSQLPGMLTSLLPNWQIFRESIPLFRYITGGLFGLLTSMYLFPMMEESMADTRVFLLRKKEIIQNKMAAKND